VIIGVARNLSGTSSFAFPFVTGLLIAGAMAAYGWSGRRTTPTPA
jgi:ribose/xylose/arabinose/galactoside ABC-type transport system permease subunit